MCEIFVKTFIGISSFLGNPKNYLMVDIVSILAVTLLNLIFFIYGK